VRRSIVPGCKLAERAVVSSRAERRQTNVTSLLSG
jgi:hypothetical protein